MKRRNFLTAFASLIGATAAVAAVPRKTTNKANILLGPGVPRQATAKDPGSETLEVYRNFNPDATPEEIRKGEKLMLVQSYNADTGEIVSLCWEAQPEKDLTNRKTIFGCARTSRHVIVDPVTGEAKTFKIHDNWAVLRRPGRALGKDIPKPASDWEKEVAQLIKENRINQRLGKDPHPPSRFPFPAVPL